MIKEVKIKQLIKFASQAPSGHNTQPWKFKYDEKSVTISPDFTRALPIVDKDNHALYISLGCALENLMIAAKLYGFTTEVNLESGRSETNILIELSAAGTPEKSDLFDYINKRQVTRIAYLPEKMSRDKVQLLFNDSMEPGISYKVFTEKEEIEALTKYIIEGSNLQFENKAFAKELASWIRFNRNSARKSGDGIWFSSMGFPGVPAWLGKLIILNLISAKSEAKRWKKTIHNSAGLVLFMVEKNNTENWINLGRSFQRFGLRAASLNINHAHVNMPCEEISVREKLIQHFQLNDLTPLLLIRFGYSKPMPYSYRRNSNEIIVK